MVENSSKLKPDIRGTHAVFIPFSDAVREKMYERKLIRNLSGSPDAHPKYVAANIFGISFINQISGQLRTGKDISDAFDTSLEDVLAFMSRAQIPPKQIEETSESIMGNFGKYVGAATTDMGIWVTANVAHRESLEKQRNKAHSPR